MPTDIDHTIVKVSITSGNGYTHGYNMQVRYCFHADALARIFNADETIKVIAFTFDDLSTIRYERV